MNTIEIYQKLMKKGQSPVSSIPGHLDVLEAEPETELAQKRSKNIFKEKNCFLMKVKSKVENLK